MFHNFLHVINCCMLIMNDQVYPTSWTAILIELDNQGMWNLRSQDAEKWYLGQELYLRVVGVGKARDEAPMPENAIKCGRAANL